MGKFKEFMSYGGGSLLGGISSGLISGIVSLIGQRRANKYNLSLANMQNKANAALQRETNAYNERLIDKQNKAAVEQAELAYNRETASNQVAQMRAAGLSKAGAINQLNGAGSYTPAPVNAAQADAPTADYGIAKSGNLFEGIANAAMAAGNLQMQYAQMKLQREQFDKELKFKERQQANIEANDEKERLAKDLENQVAKLNLDSQKAFASARSLFDESQEYYETGDDFLKYLKEVDEKTYNELMKDPNSVNVINTMVNNTNQQRSDAINLNIKNMTQEEQIQMIRDAAYVSGNSRKLSNLEIISAQRKAEQLGIQNSLLKVSLYISQNTASSIVNFTNQVNERDAVSAALDFAKAVEETEAFKRMSPEEKDKWFDNKNKLSVYEDKRGADSYSDKGVNTAIGITEGKRLIENAISSIVSFGVEILK